MKKILSVLALCCLLLFTSSALAEGGLTTVNAMFVMTPYFDSYIGFGYAEVENTSDSVMTVNYETSALKLMNAAGEVLHSAEIFSLSPTAIGPGETGFVMVDTIYLDAEIAQQLTTYSMSINGEESWYMEAPSYLSDDNLSADIVSGTDAFGDDVTWLYTLVENPSKELLFNYGVVVGLYDQQDRLIYAAEMQTYDVGIPAGQSAMLRVELPAPLVAYWAEKNIVPTSVMLLGYKDN